MRRWRCTQSRGTRASSAYAIRASEDRCGPDREGSCGLFLYERFAFNGQVPAAENRFNNGNDEKRQPKVPPQLKGLGSRRRCATDCARSVAGTHTEVLPEV